MKSPPYDIISIPEKLKQLTKKFLLQKIKITDNDSRIETLKYLQRATRRK